MEFMEEETSTGMDMTEERRIRTRAALLDAARDLVFEHEHDKSSIQEITNRAGVATGTFYNYFETKQDVFVAVVADYRARFRACVGEARAPRRTSSRHWSSSW